MNTTVANIRSQSCDVLNKIFSPDEPVALLDHPSYFNAGDNLIYQGELSYLQAMEVDVSYVCSAHTYDREVLNREVPEGTLLLQGGGNFGDRYHLHQQFREKLIPQHHNRRIIQMPQSIEFRDEAALRRAQGVYGRHPDLTLLMRDRDSLEKATASFPDNRVIFCPDAAFGAAGLLASADPTHPVILLKRNDTESNYDPGSLPTSLRSEAYQTDWHVSALDNFKWWPAFYAGLLGHKIRPIRSSMYPALRRMLDWQASLVVRNAVQIVSRGQVVVTDRLHAAIYAMLMGKPVVLVDNANRKISAAYRDYLGDSPDVHLANDFDRAGEIVQTIV